ncbi:MAG TPA: hypothetical protein VNQ77_02875 [Frankiaceae bacterium]|nr:hypothetical protein [Frankiaceae bacterium]
MKLIPALLGAGLAAASLAVPASAQDVTQGLVYTVTASHPNGAGTLDAACTFRPDWTAEYGDTVIEGVATSGVVGDLDVTCEIYVAGTLAGSASGGGILLARASGTGGTVGRTYVRVCVSARVQGVVDVGYTVSNCRNV